MRLVDHLLEASALIRAVRIGSHEITSEGLAFLDDLLVDATDDALAIEKRLAQADCVEIVKGDPLFSRPPDVTAFGSKPPPPPPAPRDDNVIDFQAKARERWPRLCADPQARASIDALVQIARQGEVGPTEGGAA
jgi:hypothetical protein